MAACGSLQNIFDNLLPENQTLLESLSWNHITTVKSLEQSSSFTEIFGELHFKDSPVSSPSSSSSPSHAYTSASTDINHTKLNQNEDFVSSDINQTLSSTSFSSTPITNHTNRHKSSDSFSWLTSESLHLCTEGLGFESSDDVEDLKNGMNECWQTRREEEGGKKHLASEDSYGECRRTRVSGGEYPPPISCIGRTGKPSVCFRSYRSNGRFVLKEIRIPTQEFLHAYREDGRLKLHFVQPDDEFLEEEEEEEEGDDDDEEEEEEQEEDVESIYEEEEDMGNENDDCVTDHANEEREIDAQVTKSLDERLAVTLESCNSLSTFLTAENTKIKTKEK